MAGASNKNKPWLGHAKDKREKGEERGGNSLLGFAIREKKRESAVVRGEGGCHVLAWMCSSQRSRKEK
jgi:hypothetical protein